MGTAQIILFRLLPYLALFICFYGLMRRVVIILSAPNPLRIPLTPAPKNRWGRLLALWEDFFVLPRLAMARPGHWLLWAGMHLCLLLLFLRHLRMVLDPVPGFVVALEPLSSLAAYLLPLLLLIRLLRRMVYPHLAWVSRPVDYGVTLLLLMASLSGLFLKLGYRADLWAAKAMLMGLWGYDFEAVPWPGDSFVAHFLLGLLVIVCLPRSPLNHFLTPLFNPIRRMADNIRSRYHLNPWDYEHQDDEITRTDQRGPDPLIRTALDYKLEMQGIYREPEP